MQATNLQRLFPAIILQLALLAVHAGAAESLAPAPKDVPALDVLLQEERVPDIGIFKRAYLTAGTNRFAFLVPTGFRLDAQVQDSVQFVNAEYNCFINLRLIGSTLRTGKELDPAPHRELLLGKFPNTKILEEFSLTAAGQNGPAFDLRFRVEGGIAQRARVGFIPTAAGILEITLISSEEKVAENQYNLNSLLITFRASVDGKLEIAPLSNKL